MTTSNLGPFDIDRIYRAVKKHRERLVCIARELEQSSIPYAIIGGSAVAEWVAKVDESAVRFTPDIDILLRREDLDAATEPLSACGYRYQHPTKRSLFLVAPDARTRDALRFVWANEPIADDANFIAPDVTDSVVAPEFRIATLDALLRTELSIFRIVNRMHVRDMIDVGLIDSSWLSRLPPELAPRLQELLDSPNG